MIKRTRMIVITKNKILAVFGLIILLILCTLCIRHLSPKKSITAFSSYENIIDSQIAPSENEEKLAVQQEKKEHKKTSIADYILKSFFMLYEHAPKAEASSTPAPEKEALLTSESLKIDKGLQISNATSFAVNPSDFLSKPLSFAMGGDGPQVLIMHTHTTESFSDAEYTKDAPDRNLDETKNIVTVGNAMAEVLQKNGIEVCHDKTVHDYPSYNGAYQRAATTIRNNLEAHKNIKVVLDIHRDGITREDGTKVKLVTEINGTPSAQIMLVVGSNAMLQHDNWQENMKFAVHLQEKSIKMFPSLMRPINLREERFNEQLSLGSLIIEVGSNGNTLEEAINGGKNFAEVISAVLKGE